MASVDDLDELIATRKLNGVNDNLYKEDSNIEDVEKLKSLLYEGRLTQYGKRKLVQYLEQKESILDKVIDKLKEYLKQIKQDGIYGYDTEIREILNIIEGEKNNK